MIDDKSWNPEPDIRFYLNNTNLLVEYVSMTTMFGLTVLERGSRWTDGSNENVSNFVYPNYSVWTYDWGNEDDTPGSGADLDPQDEISWEIELVQRWMKGQSLRFADIVETCDLLGVREYLGVDLAPREDAVVARRYGLSDGIERDWQQLAAELGVTTERIKEVAAEALEKLVYRDDSLAIACSRNSGSRMSKDSQRELRDTAQRFWNSEITHYQFTQLPVTLDTLCYLSFVYIVSAYFNMEDPGVMEVPSGALEVASNIDLLLGTLSRRMISADPHLDFSQSEAFDLRQSSWLVLTERALAADSRLKTLLDDKADVSRELASWGKSDLIDCLAISLQIAEVFEFKETQGHEWKEISPLRYFLSQEQLAYGFLRSDLEAELRRR